MHTLTKSWERYYDAYSMLVRGDFAQGARTHSGDMVPTTIGNFATGQMAVTHLMDHVVNYDD